MYRLLILFLVSIKITGTVYCQQYRYSEHEIRFDDSREQVKLLAMPGDMLHAWKYGLSGVSLHVYNQELGFLRSKNFSSRLKSVSFIRFPGFYYAVITDFTTTEIYAVNKDGSFTDMTRQFNKQHLITGERHSYSFRQGDSIVFLIQQYNDIDAQKTFLHLTALDTGLRFINKLVLEVEYLRGRAQRLQVLPLGNQLLLLNHTISRGAEALAFTKIDVAGGTFRSNYFYPEGLEFISHQLLLYGSDIILQSRVRETGQPADRSMDYTYLIKLNKDGEVLNYLYLNPAQQKGMEDNPFMSRPVTTVVLHNKQLLTIEYGIRGMKPSKNALFQLRFTRIDSSLNLLHSFNQPSTEGQYFPGLLLANKDRLHIFYDEIVRNKVNIINSYELRDTLLNERALLLNTNYLYQLRTAVPVSETSFVMPYIHNYRMGLVKVMIREE